MDSIDLTPEAVIAILGEPYDGGDEHDAIITAALVADGEADWVATARVERDGDGLRIVRR